MSSRNGSRRGRDPVEAKKEMQEEQARQQRLNSANQHNLQKAQKEIDQKKSQYLERLLKTGMTDAGINMLDNMVDGSFALGNISDAEYHEIKWDMQALFLEIKACFPPQESEVQGDVRAFLLDDADERVEALTDRQKTIIAQMIKGIQVMVSRSKGGMQQEMLVKSISVSEIMEEDEDQESAWGLFGA